MFGNRREKYIFEKSLFLLLLVAACYDVMGKKVHVLRSLFLSKKMLIDACQEYDKNTCCNLMNIQKG